VIIARPATAFIISTTGSAAHSLGRCEYSRDSAPHRSPRQELRNMPLKHSELRVASLFKKDAALGSDLLGAIRRAAALRERYQGQASLHVNGRIQPAETILPDERIVCALKRRVALQPFQSKLAHLVRHRGGRQRTLRSILNRPPSGATIHDVPELATERGALWAPIASSLQQTLHRTQSHAKVDCSVDVISVSSETDVYNPPSARDIADKGLPSSLSPESKLR